METNGFISNDLSRYLFESFKEMNKIIDRLKKDLVEDINNLTLTQIITLKARHEAYSHISTNLYKDLLKSIKTMDELYNFLSDYKDIFVGRHTYTVKEDLKRRLAVSPDLYANFARFKALNYSYVD